MQKKLCKLSKPVASGGVFPASSLEQKFVRVNCSYDFHYDRFNFERFEKSFAETLRPSFDRRASFPLLH